MENKPWQQGAVWEGTGWVWRGLEPPHAPPPRHWPRVPTQLSLKFTAPPTVQDGAVSCDA
jgi:hypothetical protein